MKWCILSIVIHIGYDSTLVHDYTQNQKWYVHGVYHLIMEIWEMDYQFFSHFIMFFVAWLYLGIGNCTRISMDLVIWHSYGKKMPVFLVKFTISMAMLICLPEDALISQYSQTTISMAMFNGSNSYYQLPVEPSGIVMVWWTYFRRWMAGGWWESNFIGWVWAKWR